MLRTIFNCEPDHTPPDGSQEGKSLTKAEKRASAVHAMQRIHHSLTISMSANRDVVPVPTFVATVGPSRWARCASDSPWPARRTRSRC